MAPVLPPVALGIHLGQINGAQPVCNEISAIIAVILIFLTADVTAKLDDELTAEILSLHSSGVTQYPKLLDRLHEKGFKLG